MAETTDEDPRIKAAADWLRSDDTAYEQAPDAALRAAREMLSAADAIDPPDSLPLLRAQSEMIEGMRQALEEIKQATQRHTLLAPTVQELQERLDTIAAIVDRSLINGI